VAKILGVLGPLIAAIGAFILILDVLRGEVRWWGLVHVPNARFKTENEQHKRFLKRLAELPSGYPEDERKKLLEKEIERHDSTTYTNQEEFSEEDLKERKLSVRLAVWGFLFILIGSLMQSGAAIWPAPASSLPPSVTPSPTPILPSPTATPEYGKPIVN
jgi:hypothetical protein